MTFREWYEFNKSVFNYNRVRVNLMDKNKTDIFETSMDMRYAIEFFGDCKLKSFGITQNVGYVTFNLIY